MSLARHATISAAIAEGDRGAADVLAAHAVDPATWTLATIHWTGRMGDEARAHPEAATLTHAYSEAFCRAQDALAPLPPTDARAWAAIVVDVQRSGGPAAPIAARGLSLADYLRLSRHWARTLSSDPAESAAFFAAYEALQPAPGAPPPVSA